MSPGIFIIKEKHSHAYSSTRFRSTDREATRNQPAATQSLATQAGSSQSSEGSSQNDIAQLAYALWEQRGCSEGSAESDWLEAEQKVRESSVDPTLAMIGR